MPINTVFAAFLAIGHARRNRPILDSIDSFGGNSGGNISEHFGGSRMTIPLNIPLAYFVSVFVGYVAVGGFLWLARRTTGLPRKGTFTWDQFWIGGTERFIATTLVIVAPRYVGAFAVAWLGLKLGLKLAAAKGR